MAAIPDTQVSAKPRGRRPSVRLPVSSRLALCWIVVMVMLAIFAGLLAPYGFSESDPFNRLKSPIFFGGEMAHILGTDQIGRDVLSRLLLGIRVSLGIAFLGTLIGAMLGSLLGILAAHFRGFVDEVVMGLVDFQASVPFVVFAIAALAVFDSSLTTFIIILGIAGWERYARLMRALVLSAENNGYADALISLGAPSWRIYLRHIVPNVIGALSVQMTINFPETILLETGLSFLGLGVRPPLTSLGLLVSEGRPYIYQAWWLILAPGLMIFLTTLSVSLLGDTVRDRIDASNR